MANDPKDVVKQWYGKVGSRDWEGMRELMAPDFKNHYPPSIEEEPLDRDELIDFFQHFEWWINIRDIFSEGNKVAVRAKITNKQVKELDGLPPSDEKRSVPGAVIWRVEEGQVAEAWAFPDSHGTFQQMGLTFPRILVTLPKILLRKLLP